MRLAPAVLASKPLSECTEKDFKKLIGSARRHAIKCGRGYLQEDFASFAAEAVIKQGYLKYRLDWLWSTFLRESLGNLKNKKGLAMAQANSQMTAIDKEAFRVKDDAPAPGSRVEWEDFLKDLDLKSRVILALRFEFDFDCPDIGRVLGISHQRVHQIMADLFDRYKAGKVMVPPGRGGKPRN